MEVYELTRNKALNDSKEVTFDNIKDWLLKSDFWIWLYDALLSYWRIIFSNATAVNMLIYSLKYVPTGIFMYGYIKEYYVNSREEIKNKKLQIEELEIQIEKINTNTKKYKEECEKFKDELNLEIETIRSTRERVYEYISKDEELKALYSGTMSSESLDLDGEVLLYDLLKDLKFKNYDKPLEGIIKYAENVYTEDAESLRPTASEGDMKECQVKIMKVTNIYKVAYLKNYVKQKRMRRANKQAEFSKKMDNVKNLLDEWQKMLTIGIRNKLIFNLEPNTLDSLSQEAIVDNFDVRHTDSTMDIRQCTSDSMLEDVDPWIFEQNMDPYRREEHIINSDCEFHNTLYPLEEETVSQLELAEHIREEIERNNLIQL